MPVEILKYGDGIFVSEETIDGSTVSVDMPFNIVKATPDRGGVPPQIFLQCDGDRRRWRWAAPIDDWSDTVSSDPAVESRWETA